MVSMSAIVPPLNENALDDLTATRRCAEAMGYETDGTAPSGYGCAVWLKNCGPMAVYHPLHDDAQCMALVKKFRLLLTPHKKSLWCVETDPNEDNSKRYVHADLNKCIVYCVAAMQEAKS